MKSQIYISIITPVFNGFKFIEDCLDSVLTQNCPYVEHVIVDACSTDGTVDLIAEYAARHRHIRWISEPDNGQSDALNKGIEMASGNIIGVLNSDDFYEPGSLNRVVHEFRKLSEPTFLVGNCRLLGQDDCIEGINRPNHLSLFNILTYQCPHPCNPSAYFYHKSLHDEIGYYDTGDDYTMDLDFVLRALSICSIKYVDEILGNFRQIPGTKTYASKAENKHFSRKSSLIRKYQSHLPLLQSISISVVRKVVSAGHFLFHPQDAANYLRQIIRTL